MNRKDSKRILVVGLTERMGGVESFIYNTTKFSNKDKYQYDYLVHGSNHCVFQKEISDFYNDERHIFFVRKIKENPVCCYYDLIRFYRVNGRKYKYIHFQTGATSEIMYIFPFSFIYGIKVISHSHSSNGYNPIINKMFRPIVNLVTDKWLTCSKLAGEWLFGKKYAKKAIIINNGIDTERFIFDYCKRQKIRDKYNIGNELVIGHIGRFSIEKNHEKIIEIFLELLKINKDAKLLLVGVGERQELIYQKVKEMSMANSVIFAGKQIETEAYYSAFDVFLMPSLYEGLPIVGVEAQAEGLHCYFSDQVDKQIKITDRAHIIKLERTSSEWAKKILSDINKNVKDREKYSKLISEKGYSIRETVRKLEDIYEV